jgi:hypothetical protein
LVVKPLDESVRNRFGHRAAARVDEQCPTKLRCTGPREGQDRAATTVRLRASDKLQQLWRAIAKPTPHAPNHGDGCGIHAQIVGSDARILIPWR